MNEIFRSLTSEKSSKNRSRMDIDKGVRFPSIGVNGGEKGFVSDVYCAFWFAVGFGGDLGVIGADSYLVYRASCDYLFSRSDLLFV